MLFKETEAQKLKTLKNFKLFFAVILFNFYEIFNHPFYSNISFLKCFGYIWNMKAEITKELIEHVAEVARLKLTDKEIEKFSKELKEIIDVFSKLDKVDTKGIEASMQPVELKNTLREDKEKKPFTQEEALSLTEHKRDGYFKGPRAV